MSGTAHKADVRSGGQPGSVAVISSHVARGAVGNRAAVFAIETLGHPVIAVPTVLLPWHPGHGPATRIVHDNRQFAGFMANLAHGPFAGEIDAVLSGYLGDAGQAAAIAASVAALRSVRPDLVYACDPVIGDESGLYVSGQVARAIAGTLVPVADLATPNRFELAWLSGRVLEDNEAIIDAARALGPPAVLVTSAFAARPGMTGNLLVLRETAHLAEHAAFDRAPNGTGDLTAALFLAHLVNGRGHLEALRRATASVHDVLANTRARGADELTLAADAALLSEPVSDIDVRSVGRRSEDITIGG
ncbi:MAG: pyridoxal kinase PdxY [Roseitalea sp.]|nr:pyridoxal kinase PdxY [Roseitalea sp.]MBO6953397.1 pyridoxal kinase PdxY [Rhizobiaceae bacterium]MBO6593834.1 pyridoxal kinase PdxY [Roseitalea sp.]MBO6601141.1 pyridoxal kinase PdxY [Roseitalea sp.]MBO6613873.1 pyridoxal kinase PdxY [Roseitalea sp.]